MALLQLICMHTDISMDADSILNVTSKFAADAQTCSVDFVKFVIGRYKVNMILSDDVCTSCGRVLPELTEFKSLILPRLLEIYEERNIEGTKTNKNYKKALKYYTDYKRK